MSKTDTSSKEVPATSLYDDKANKIIRNYSLAASGSGFIPHPLLSSTGVTAFQILLIKDLCELYQIPFSEKRLNVVLTSVLGSAAVRLITFATRTIPGISKPMEGLTGATISGFYTASIGEFYKVHFQNGGNLDNADFRDLGWYFIEEYNRGSISLNDLTNPQTILERIIGKA